MMGITVNINKTDLKKSPKINFEDTYSPKNPMMNTSTGFSLKTASRLSKATTFNFKSPMTEERGQTAEG